MRFTLHSIDLKELGGLPMQQLHVLETPAERQSTVGYKWPHPSPRAQGLAQALRVRDTAGWDRWAFLPRRSRCLDPRCRTLLMRINISGI